MLHHSELYQPKARCVLLARSPGENKVKIFFKRKWMQPLHYIFVSFGFNATLNYLLPALLMALLAGTFMTCCMVCYGAYNYILNLLWSISCVTFQSIFFRFHLQICWMQLRVWCGLYLFDRNTWICPCKVFSGPLPNTLSSSVMRHWRVHSMKNQLILL